MKRFKSKIMIGLVILILVILQGCTDGFEFESIDIDSSTLSDYYEIGSLDLSDISFTIILNEEGEELILKASDFTLSDEDLLKLETPGTHTLTLIYKETLTYDLTVTMVSSEEYNTFLAVYKMGLAAGAINISYEEWLNSIRGEDGSDGKDGKQIYLQVSDNFIQYQYDGDTTWINLISLVDLTGAKGEPGSDGKEVTFSVNDEYIQWQYIGETTWKNLIALDTLKQGPKGDPGKNVTLRVADGYIQWQNVGDTTWRNLVQLTSLVGPQGLTGPQGTPGQPGTPGAPGQTGPQGPAGLNGKNVEFRTYNNYIQWRYVGENNWQNLVSLTGLNKGEDGKSAYQIYLEHHPEYTKTEAEWIDDVINHRLAESKKWNVTYNFNDGITANQVIQAEHLNKLTKPIDPTRLGYDFVGWYIEEEYWSFIGYIVTSDMELKAKWEAADFTITYNTMGGDPLNPYTAAYNTALNSLSIPTKTGFQFDGWYEDESLTTSFTSTTMPAENITLYAKWMTGLPNVWTIRNVSETETSLTIQISVEGVVNFIGFDTNITYHTTELTLDSITNTLGVVLNSNTPGTIMFNYVDVLNKKTSSTNILTINFTKINPTLQNGLTITVNDMISITSAYDIVDVEYNIA